AEDDAPRDRHEAGETEDARDEQPGKAVIDGERHLVRDHREHGERRARVREEERPERARPESGPDADAAVVRRRPSARRRSGRRARRVAYTHPHEGDEERQRADPENQVRVAPAVGGDEPLREWPHQRYSSSSGTRNTENENINPKVTPTVSQTVTIRSRGDAVRGVATCMA